MSLSAMYPHRIRLRGPWQCEPIDGVPSPTPPLPGGEGRNWRVIVPCGWLAAGLAGFAGAARFTRSFGYPGHIDDTEHVWLTGDGCIGCREVRLNGQLLTDTSCVAFSFDVTKILSPRNRLEVVLQADADRAGLWGEIAMEVRKDAYLADVKVERNATTTTVIGKAVGTSPQLLELYTLVDGQHDDYRTIAPSADGVAFRIALSEVSASSQIVRVELISISSIWYVVELPIPHWHSA